jgi:hypothetical protein
MPPSWAPISEEKLSWAEAEALRTENTVLKQACATWRNGETDVWDQPATDALQVVNAFLSDVKMVGRHHNHSCLVT